MNCLISPYKGVGNVSFGMSQDQVSDILGESEHAVLTTLGETEERRDGITIRYDGEGVVEFAFLPGDSPQFGSTDLLSDPDSLSVLLEADRNPKECLGFLLFLELGIAVTGIHDGDHSQKSVTVFPQGRWDSLVEHFKAFTA